MRDPRPFIVTKNGSFFSSFTPTPRSRPAVGRRSPRGHDRRSHRRAASTVVAAMIPDTKNGLPAMACVSAMQKAIRRGLEREAMEFACELLHTGKAFHSMVCNRLEVICHEDLDTMAAPHVVPFVATAVAQSRDALQQDDRRSPADGGQCDPHDVPGAEVPRGLSLRCRHRASIHA